MLAFTMKRCPHCGYRGKPVRESVWLLWLAAAAWLVPLGFLAFGFWPFFLLPAAALSAWAWLAVRPQCPACRARWTS
jgi:hypothetical protein